MQLLALPRSTKAGCSARRASITAALCRLGDEQARCAAAGPPARQRIAERLAKLRPFLTAVLPFSRRKFHQWATASGPCPINHNLPSCHRHKALAHEEHVSRPRAADDFDVIRHAWKSFGANAPACRRITRPGQRVRGTNAVNARPGPTRPGMAPMLRRMLSYGRSV